MIRIERARMPAGAQAVALRQDGRIVVYVSEELSGRERLAAVREALRAAPAAGWRPPRSPVLLPALALSAGLRQVPESRWSYRMAVAAVAGAVLLITATSLATVTVEHGGVHQPAAAGPGRPPLTGAGPATSQSATGRDHGQGSDPGGQPGNGSSPTQPGTAPKPGKTTTTSAGGGASPPAPQASGSPAPVATSVPTSGSSPQPSQAPSPSPSPSPAKQSGGSGACVDVLGITVCL
jgi:hypothetical protein